MADPEFITFGCRLNTYETEVMRAHAEKAGVGNAIVFNTCAVTAEATRQARQAIRRAHAQNPDAQIIVTGCAAQTEPEMFAQMPEVARVLGDVQVHLGRHTRLTTTVSGEGALHGRDHHVHREHAANLGLGQEQGRHRARA